MKEKANCFLCNRYDYLEEHHVFQGRGRRMKSDKYNAVVYLCPACHRTAPDAVHNSKMTREFLQEKFQRKLMDKYGWSVEDFIREFGKSYV